MAPQIHKTYDMFAIITQRLVVQLLFQTMNAVFRAE